MNKSPYAATAKIEVRVTPMEKRAIQEAARREGVTVSELVREAVENRCCHDTVETGDLP